MAIEKCPKCGNDISDQSSVCIHCGFPIMEKTENETSSTPSNETMTDEETTKKNDDGQDDQPVLEIDIEQKKTNNIFHQIVKSKRNLIVIGAIAVVAVVVAVVLLLPSEFDRVENEVVYIAGRLTGGEGYFTLDTYPDDYENMSFTSSFLEETQEKALKGIRFANEKLGFSGALYNRMLETTALMGRQSEENDKYKVSWTYHPSHGLEVTYEKK